MISSLVLISFQDGAGEAACSASREEDQVAKNFFSSSFIDPCNQVIWHIIG